MHLSDQEMTHKIESHIDFINNISIYFSKRYNLDKDELQSEVLLTVWKNRRQFSDVDSNFKGWIATVTRNKAVSEILKLKKKALYNSYEITDYNLNQSFRPDYGENRSQLALMLRAVKRKFPYPRYIYFYLYLKGYKYREIAVIFNTDLSIVRAFIYRQRMYIQSKFTK